MKDSLTESFYSNATRSTTPENGNFVSVCGLNFQNRAIVSFTIKNHESKGLQIRVLQALQDSGVRI